MATCSSKLKGETEQEFRKRCGGYTYAFPIDILQKKEEEPSTEEPPTEPTPPAPEGGIEEAKHTKGGIYKGKLKIGGVPVPVEVEMVGADNRTRSYLVRVIHIDKKYWSKLPKDGIIPIPSRIFDIPGGGWAKLKTPSVFENQKYYDKLKEIETMVTELLKKRIKEDWTNKYKKSIDCNNPKGFSQKAHCAGRNARQRGEDTKSNSVK